jgi:transketolase
MSPTKLSDPRESFVDELIAVAASEERLVVVDADVSRTTRTRRFRDAYPDRFYDLGVAEQNLFGVAAGLASTGCIPVAVTLAVFASMRACEQVRTSICYPALNVKVIGGYAGLSNGKDGATHQSLEDVAITRSFPNLVVMSPSDAVMARKVARAAVTHVGPVYVRLEYEETPLIYSDDLDFHIGRGIRLREGADLTIASYGVAVARALAAADALVSEGIRAEVLDMPTLKPFDAELLLASARKTGALLTLEDHNVIGGLASAACESLIAASFAPPFRALGVRDVFTESGRNDDLREKLGIGTGDVVRASRELASQGRAAKRMGAL